MLAGHREEIVLCLVETLASAGGKISYLVVTLFDDGGRPICFGSHRLRGAYWRFYTLHQTHGCA